MDVYIDSIYPHILRDDETENGSIRVEIEDEDLTTSKTKKAKINDVMDVITNEILDIQRECAKPGWDGYDADPIDKEVITASIKFLKLLFEEDLQINKANIAPAPNGSIVLEWRANNKEIFAISITDRNKYNYALITENEQVSDKGEFNNCIPSEIKYLLIKYVAR